MSIYLDLSGTVPVAFMAGDMTIPSHASFKGTVLFQNVFHGKLPATDYPKIRVCISAAWPLRAHAAHSYSS